jgi:aminopeptidase N
VNADPPGDQYPKGGNLLHTIRQLVNDDAKWRGILRGLNQTFWHRTVTSAQVEGYITRESRIDLGPVFEQYLRTTQIPLLQYELGGDTLAYRWNNVVAGFAMPLRVTLADTTYGWIHPTTEWQRTAVRLSRPDLFGVDENFYVEAKAVLAGKGGT